MKTYTANDIEEKMELEDGLTARVTIECDQGSGPPWKESDGHGPVSDWTTRDKRPGERVLCEDRHSKRFYDWATAIKEAKRDGWDAPPYKTGTKGEQAERAVEADFQFLKDWCDDRWHYVVVCVELFDADGNESGSDSLCGVEDNNGYDREQAAEMLNNLLEAHAREVVEAEACAARGIMTEARR